MKESTFSTRDLRKAAFAVGFGFTFGKIVAEWTDVFCKTIFCRWFTNKAKNGDEWAQSICNNAGVKYKGDSEVKESEE